MAKFSILIPSYGEKERLFDLVNVILKDRLRNKISRIIVVSPDKNITLPKSRKIEIIREKKRKGKYFAIRLGLKKIKTRIVVMLSSDLRMRKNFLYFLINPLKDPKVGMVIGRPIADKNSRIYSFSKIIWNLHHILCLKKPKGTEICAFRKIFNSFPKVSADEVYIEYRIRKAGYKIVYEPRAFGYTRVPDSLISFFKQRKRIALGHFNIIKRYAFITSSFNVLFLLKVLLLFVSSRNKKKFQDLLSLIIVIIIEIFARIVAGFEFFLTRKDSLVWER